MAARPLAVGRYGANDRAKVSIDNNVSDSGSG